MNIYTIVIVAFVAAALISVVMADSGAFKRKRDYENYDGYDPDAGPWRIGDRNDSFFD